MSLPRRFITLPASRGSYVAVLLLLGLLLTLGPCFAAEGYFADCAKKTLDSLPSPQPTLKLLDALDIEAWLKERMQASAASLRSQSMDQSQLWLQIAMERLVHSDALGSDKTEAFSRFVVEIGDATAELQAAARNQAAQWRSVNLHHWNCRRFDVGAGVSAFIGDSGRVLEFRPNGDIYRAIIRNIGAVGPLSPDFRPPYSDDGTPWLDPKDIHLIERRILRPR